MAKQKIYDCFAFFNELDILEIRLTELYDVVDYFVIVEATTKFSGEKKPLYFKENGNRFKKWGEKIIHIIVEPPKLNFIDKFNIFWEKKKIFTANKIGRNFVVGKWKLDYWQKNQTALGLKNAKEGDIIFLSDADEIIPKKIVKQAINMLSKHPSSIIKVNNQCFYYYLNGKCSDDSIGNAACKYKLLKEKLNNQPQRIRENYGFLNLLMV
ncbi:MAG: hypothetical protein KJ674_05150, partial [Nanoarchaeota archaeon]|nr:hypothetical protein [Nanoarchaeota archaeon]